MLLAFSQCFTHTNAITLTGNPFFFSRASILVTQQIHVWLRENRFCLMLESMILASVTLCDDVVTLPYVYMRF